MAFPALNVCVNPILMSSSFKEEYVLRLFALGQDFFGNLFLILRDCFGVLPSLGPLPSFTFYDANRLFVFPGTGHVFRPIADLTHVVPRQTIITGLMERHPMDASKGHSGPE